MIVERTVGRNNSHHKVILNRSSRPDPESHESPGSQQQSAPELVQLITQQLPPTLPSPPLTAPHVRPRPREINNLITNEIRTGSISFSKAIIRMCILWTYFFCAFSIYQFFFYYFWLRYLFDRPCTTGSNSRNKRFDDIFLQKLNLTYLLYWLRVIQAEWWYNLIFLIVQIKIMPL